MRIVLDTNILVRAAGDEHGLAGRLLQEIIAGPHILVTSPYILSEIARVTEFVNRVGDAAEIVLTTTPDPVIVGDPDDDPIVQTAVLGRVDCLCTRDAHVLEAAVLEYCASRGINITNDIDLYHTLTGRPRDGRAQQ
ncbi:MAG TPA: PIN domain-containing protein [Verrucomicrobiae bacterium]|nr:PIN domain-containing protein [Verrucomicrobiae bacterium]